MQDGLLTAVLWRCMSSELRLNKLFTTWLITHRQKAENTVYRASFLSFFCCRIFIWLEIVSLRSVGCDKSVTSFMTWHCDTWMKPLTGDQLPSLYSLCFFNGKNSKSDLQSGHGGLYGWTDFFEVLPLYVTRCSVEQVGAEGETFSITLSIGQPADAIFDGMFCVLAAGSVDRWCSLILSVPSTSHPPSLHTPPPLLLHPPYTEIRWDKSPSFILYRRLTVAHEQPQLQ